MHKRISIFHIPHKDNDGYQRKANCDVSVKFAIVLKNILNEDKMHLLPPRVYYNKDLIHEFVLLGHTWLSRLEEFGSEHILTSNAFKNYVEFEEEVIKRMDKENH